MMPNRTVIHSLAIDIAHQFMLDTKLVEQKLAAMQSLGMSDIISWFCMYKNLYKKEKAKRKKQAIMEEQAKKIVYVQDGAQYVEHIDSQTTQNFYGSNSHAKTLMSDDELRERINVVMCDIKVSRHWFSVIKVLMLRGQAKVNDFQGAAKRIESLYPAGLAVNIDPVDLQSMHYGSFRQPFVNWCIGDGPIKREADLRTYITIANKFDSLFI